ncbi:alanyl-tRNA synthetase [Halogeometricum borinquense DSM 11551]|uniref:Alanyl-tRNA synthetase n=1 Tax=Halogeometricum borinquense (strain ATCC 700274 / DSM 11551 / JCM 10706 / KCTC 4070 / PR3) TaxID=469382 RepID=E4NR34_HALBP|nr:DHHA1 domain-containing protein [Halogeometricum borinquense]ADQ66770.1 alanyl-tRNA synthetase [Halogeometricum borinquense DSM 11551]ELY30278.1 alanyl-tRNA synthetase [Halogeometricum borinquense DSM 11551]
MLTRAPEEPTVREFDAAATSVDGRDVTLDQTYFYAESGGQPADRGTLGGIPLDDVQKVDGNVVHTLASAPDFDEGETITGVIDDDFRTYCMRAHTASHVLYGAGRRILSDLGYGGFDISPEKVRVDFVTTTEIDDEVLVELERLVNRAVWDARPVSWEEVPAEEAFERDDVAFNTKTEEGVMGDSDTIRLVTVEDWDVAACGGTHVSNTLEIGPVTVLGRSNPGEGLTRVEFAVGPTGIDRRATVHRAALDTACELETSVDDTAEAAASLRAEKQSIEAERRKLESELLTERITEFETLAKNGAQWHVGVIDGFDSNDAGEAAKDVVRDENETDVVAAVGAGERPYLVVAAGSDSGVDAGDVVSRATDEFGGGGGGGATFAQGGGLDADPADVTSFLKDA